MSTQFDLVVRNSTVVSGTGRRRADVAADGGRFVEIAPPGRIGGRGQTEIDAAGLFVLPGLIDGHVHFREPGLEHKEDWETGSRAAVMGGVTTVLDMPNTVPPTASVADARAKARLAAAKSYCDFGLFGLVGTDNLDDLAGVANSGLVVGFKVFLGDTVGSIGAPAARDLAAAMKVIGAHGLRLGAHAEDRGIVERATAALRAAGRSDVLAHLESRPATAEAVAISALGEFARESGCPVHVFHVSSTEGLTALEVERRAGADMTAEVSAHHCFLSADDYAVSGSLMKTNPPVREAGQGTALLAALAAGRIDMIASDHAPHAPAEKLAAEAPAADTWMAAPGIAGVETTLRLFLTHGVHAVRLTLERLVAALAESPARTWGLWPRKGAIEIGADADLTLIDLEREGSIRGAELHGKHGVTPFEGWPTRGAAVATIVRGRVVMRDGELVGEPGRGSLVQRQG